jgi:BirA family biotin operon repressor/biotin-[acetyl-CoA-carboxylase] ligase
VEEKELEKIIAGLPIGPLRYFESIGSTNDLAKDWIESGADHLSLVVADEQIAGRGRNGRRWFTPPGSSIAFSLVLHSDQLGNFALPMLSGLGALGVCATLRDVYGLEGCIKWPNDILIQKHKLAGVLVETAWSGAQLQSAVLGIGINVARESMPADSILEMPATSVERELGKVVERWSMLREVLKKLLFWLRQIDSPSFLQAWEQNLAYKGEMVQLTQNGRKVYEGRLLGLDTNGAIRLRGSNGDVIAFQAGDLQLRTVDSL